MSTLNLRFHRREVRDLLVAWLALGVAFTLFVDRSIVGALSVNPTAISIEAVATVFALSLITVGTGFLLHELAHKIVAVRFGQVAAFRADYGMLFLAVLGGVVGFLFAAPGAVYHRGRITKRENGLIAAAGPITNLVLAVAFFTLGLAGESASRPFLATLGIYGFRINLLLAGFNMLPWGPLDGRKVLDWNWIAFGVLAVPSIGLGVLVLFGGL